MRRVDDVVGADDDVVDVVVVDVRMCYAADALDVAVCDAVVAVLVVVTDSGKTDAAC